MTELFQGLQLQQKRPDLNAALVPANPGNYTITAVSIIAYAIPKLLSRYMTAASYNAIARNKNRVLYPWHERSHNRTYGLRKSIHWRHYD